MKLYFIAGESSGDYIGSRIIESLKKLSSEISTDNPQSKPDIDTAPLASSLSPQELADLEIMGIGGDLMQQQGIKSLFPIEQINLMGFIEVIPHIFKIKKLIDETVTDIAYRKPDILITIDSPGFTKRVAKEVKKHVPDVKLLHIVAPSVWAYKPGRAKEYAQIYDYLFTLLPFEPKYFEKHGLKSTHIGHPVLEQKFMTNSSELKSEFKIPADFRTIAITPGSRNGEIIRHMPIIRKALDRLSQTNKIMAIFVQPNDTKIKLISKYLTEAKFDYMYSTDRLKAFAVSDVALAKSGTNTLEIAASGTPQIIGYKLNAMSFIIIKLMIKIRFACLINIIAGKEIIPEFIQSDFTDDNLLNALTSLFGDNKRGISQVKESQKILSTIGYGLNKTPSEIAAKRIFEIYEESKNQH